jgi:hypothetical protein
MAAASLFFTWSRLFVGMDLKDESYYVVLPWRWVLGERPFVNEQTLFQVPAMLEYPFLKPFGLLRGNDSTGLILYTRHLYLLMMIGVAAAVFLLLRRLVLWQLALVISCVSFTYIFWATPQLSYDTMALAFLTLGVVFGTWVVVLGKGRGYALASGAAFGVAVVAYPTLLFVMPFFAVLLAFAHGRRAAAVLAQGAFSDPPDPEGPPTGRLAWRALSAWAAGGALVLVPVGVLLASFGLENVRRSWQSTITGAHTVGQLGGAAKAVAVARGFWSLVTWQPVVIAAALLIFLLYRRWPRLGRALLASVPLVLWAAAQRPFLDASGYVQAYVFLAPYLFLFIPRSKREAGARLLIWAWASALIAGVMTAYTSAVGYVNSAVGLAPAMMVSGLFLAWALETVTEAAPRVGLSLRRARAPWLALVVLVAVVGVSVAFQFAFQQHLVPYRTLTSRFDSGPWWGIKVTPERRAQVDSLAAGLHATARPGDSLLVLYVAPGYYLFWPGTIASYAYWMGPDPFGALPAAEIAYFRANHVVPTLVVRLIPTTGLTPAQIATGSAGLGYPAVLVRPGYVIYRKPAGETTAEVLARLPRK